MFMGSCWITDGSDGRPPQHAPGARRWTSRSDATIIPGVHGVLRGKVAWLEVVGAYRYIDMDDSTGKGSSYFLYDMAISGPAPGVAFSF